MDGLSAVLDLLRLRGVVYFHSDFCDAWGMDNAEVAHMSFHLVVSGHCTVTYEDQIHTLHQGDIVIFPHGTAHQIKAHTEAKTLPGNRVGQSILEGASLFGEGEVTTTLICGHFEVDRRYGHPFLQQLPVALIVQGQNQAQLTWMELTIRTIMEETKSHEAGADLVSTRLAEVLLIRTLRQYLKQTHHAPTYLRALEDERLSRVLARIHQDPSGDHSLETLAHEAG
ncbi:MAG TPA: hypothetical protein DCR93_09780, partial [Cytophagales bacterium]|nr:hypothetical protein [Cytophagales bacterium]